MDTFLPPKFSMSPFFVRHVAHPKRVRHIEGLNRVPICNVNDDGYFPPKKNYSSAFPPNTYNDNMIKSYDTASTSTGDDSQPFQLKYRRKERAIPPQGRFQTFGLIDDVDKWRNELAELANSVGLYTQDDIEKKKKQKERAELLKQIEKQSKEQQQVQSKPTTAKSTAKPQSTYSSKTSRLNEPLLAGRRTSRGSLASRALLTGPSYIVDENDREVWMLQVLCQILQTDSLVDVQSWLVSSDPTEKEKVKKLIDHAMHGLESTGRIDRVASGTDTVRSRDAEVQTSDGNLESIQNAIERMSAKTPLIKESLRRSTSMPSTPSHKKPATALNGSQNYLKLPDISEHKEQKAAISTKPVNMENSVKTTLETIPERDTQILKIEDTDNSPISPIFNINIFPNQVPSTEQRNSPVKQMLKLDGPQNDLKVEEVKVMMIVKDEKSNVTQKFAGNWKPGSSIVANKNVN